MTTMGSRHDITNIGIEDPPNINFIEAAENITRAEMNCRRQRCMTFGSTAFECVPVYRSFIGYSMKDTNTDHYNSIGSIRNYHQGLLRLDRAIVEHSSDKICCCAQ